MRLIGEEIALGTQWGSAPPPGTTVSLPHDAESYTKEGKSDIETLIDNVDSAMSDVLVEEQPQAPVLKVVEAVQETGPADTNDEAQNMLDSLLGAIPEEPSTDEPVAYQENGISDDALSGDDLDALINGDWS